MKLLDLKNNLSYTPGSFFYMSIQDYSGISTLYTHRLGLSCDSYIVIRNYVYYSYIKTLWSFTGYGGIGYFRYLHGLSKMNL